ncbi:MAG: hypothetical protein HY856_15805 [Burkholderiales bacterium]|nr:hypothetical protein [Burkholderiales bacterium]
MHASLPHAIHRSPGGWLGRLGRTLLAVWLLAMGVAIGLLVMAVLGVTWLVARLTGRRRPLPRPVFVARGWASHRASRPAAPATGMADVVDIEAREITPR